MDPSSLAQHPLVRQARASIQELDPSTVEEQLQIVRIAAPPNQESVRAAYVERRFGEVGLHDVCTDRVGNVIGRLEGPGAADGDPLIVSAHLDTVFAADVDLTPRREGDRISAPGITDNARGLAALIALASVAVRHRLELQLPLFFVATVGEEGIGDLRGTKHLFRTDGPFASAAAFISLDGSGLRRIVHRAIGSRRLRVTITGAGGHSWSDWGAANPVHAAGATIAAVSKIDLPREPVATLTVARVGGGTSINAIPASAWLEVDIRSGAAHTLERIESECRQAVGEAVTAENERRRAGSRQLCTTIEVIGDRPAGSVAPDHPLVVAAQRATRAVGARPELAASSTDSNIPISRGIPAVTLGAGGRSGGVHTLEEWYDNKRGALGIERALLLLVEIGRLRTEPDGSTDGSGATGRLDARPR